MNGGLFYTRTVWDSAPQNFFLYRILNMELTFKMRKSFHAGLSLLAALSLFACETVSPPTTARVPQKTRILETRTLTATPETLPSGKKFTQEGVASWYGPDFHQKRTANGEVYDMYGMTAAHKTLPFNVYVKVTNQANGKSVVVRINDRGPFAKDRIIDLTYSAAHKLGMLENGTALVKIEGLGLIREVEGQKVYVAPASYAIEGTLTLQVGSFKKKESAELLASQLEKEFPHVHVVEFEQENEKFHRVLVGKYTVPEEAEKDKARLVKAGFTGAHILTE